MSDGYPNIIIIMTDQHRADVCAREGFSLPTTPSLDELAERGVWFERAYSSAPLCVPARVSLLTGRYPSAHRVRENRGSQYAYYHKDIIDVLKGKGYRTAMIGKNHSHLRPEMVDHWCGFSHDGGEGARRTAQEEAFDDWLKALNHGVAQEPTPFPLECQGPFRMVSDAQRWVDSVHGHPFFMWLSFAEPHNPYQVPEPYFSMFPEEDIPSVSVGSEGLVDKSFKWQFTRALGHYVYPDYDQMLPRARANYFGMVRLIDDQVSRLVRYLEAINEIDNTVLVFVADHGDFVGEYGLMRKGPEIPEPLIRIPMQFSGPGIVAQGRSDLHVSIVDVFPTICEMVGEPLPAGVQGRSLWPVLTGGEYPREEFGSIYAEQGFGGLHYVESDEPDFTNCLIVGPNNATFDELNTYSQSGTMRMVRRDDWKLVMDMQGHGQLYNLSEDPHELRNLYKDERYLDVRSGMLEQLVVWILRMADPLPLPKDKYVPKVDPRNYWTPHV